MSLLAAAFAINKDIHVEGGKQGSQRRKLCTCSIEMNMS